MAEVVAATLGISAASSELLEGQVLVKLKGYLMPQVDVVRSRNLFESLQYKLADQSKLPKDTYQEQITYFFPVFSLLGFI